MFDFHSAYLNGILDDGEVIYMEQPPYHEIKDRSLYVLKLRKALYGLKQAGSRSPIQQFSTSIIKETLLFLAVHVDDSTITGNSIDLIAEYKERIDEQFQITDLGSISWLLGLAISRDHTAHTLSVPQQSYIETVLRRLHLDDAKPLSIPMDPNIYFQKINAQLMTVAVRKSGSSSFGSSETSNKISKRNEGVEVSVWKW